MHVLFSFQRTGPALRRGIQATAHPAWWGSQTGISTVFRGTFLHYYGHLGPSTPFSRSRQSRARAQKPPLESDVGKPSVVVSDLGAREAGNLGTAAVSERRAAINERRRRNSILRAGGGLVNPDYHCLRAILPSPVAVNPGARHVTTASHTAGQPPRE